MVVTTRQRQFETVPVSEALRSAMKSAARKLHKTKTEPYATAVRPQAASDADRRDEQRPTVGLTSLRKPWIFERVR